MTIVNWTLKAQAALDKIHDYIYQEAPYYAERVVQQIIESANRLDAFPLSGRAVPEAERDDIREVIFQNYRIIYWVMDKNRIDILTVLHSTRDLTNPDHHAWNAH